MKKPIRTSIVDDHPGVRIEIRNLLASAEDIIVVGEGANGEEAIRLVQQAKPDVLLLDVELPVLRGDEVIRRLREAKSNVKVLAISSYDDPMYILGMLENGAAGYIVKDEAPQLLLRAIYSIVQDQVKWISPRVARKISQIQLEDKTFTGRELEILRLIAVGKNDEEINRVLDIDEDLLKKHIELLMDKLKVASREQLKDAAQEALSTINS